MRWYLDGCQVYELPVPLIETSACAGFGGGQIMWRLPQMSEDNDTMGGAVDSCRHQFPRSPGKHRERKLVSSWPAELMSTCLQAALKFSEGIFGQVFHLTYHFTSFRGNLNKKYAKLLKPSFTFNKKTKSNSKAIQHRLENGYTKKFLTVAAAVQIWQHHLTESAKLKERPGKYWQD